ncbi:MAG: hypothetical protein ABL974_19855 [Prosthecobacter sp.]
MKPIDIVFRIELPGYDFGKVEFDKTSPEYKNITVEYEPEGHGVHHILVRKLAKDTHPKSLRPLVDEAMNEAIAFAYAFAAAAELKFEGYSCLGYRMNGQLHSLESLKLTNSASMTLTARMMVKVGAPRIAAIKSRLKTPFDLNRLHLFFSAACIVDRVARFVSLYTALLHVFDDSQMKVDQALLQIDPTIQQTRRPGKPSIFETVFTRLRNEFSHKRDNCTMLRTHEEIEANVDRFEDLARKILVQ